MSEPARADTAAKETGPSEYLLTADEIDYDQQNQTVLALRHVQLSDPKYILLSPSLFYDQKNDIVEGSKGLSLLQPDGSVLYARTMRMDSDFSHGYAERVSMRMVDDSLFAALQARRYDSRYTVFDHGVFSPCLLCAEDPRKPPLWQMKAERVTHDQQTHDLIYHNATLNMWGIPVFYTPYFTNPDPTVKRRTGFLTPVFGSNPNLGFFTTIPYYITFTPDFDITIRPTFSGVDGIRWQDTLRKRFESGEIQLTSSLVVADRTNDDNSISHDQLRGHLQGFAHFNLTPIFRTGADFAVLTDKSYADRYKEEDIHEDILTNRVFVEGMKGRDFTALEFFYFQNNRPGPQPEEPLLLPRFRFSALGEPNMTLGGRWSFDGILTSLQREDGPSNRKFGVDFGWERRDVLPGGMISTLTGHVRDDLFWVDHLPDPFKPGVTHSDEFANRLFPVGQAALHYPLVNAYESFSHIVEPIFSFTASPVLRRNGRIPNEDSLDIGFDATNLFDINRYPGTDQQEQGERMAYGLRNAFYLNSGGQGEVLLGQSYRLTKDPLFPTGTGVDERFSDYVGEILLDPGTWLHLDYLFRMDHDSLDTRKQDVKVDFGAPEFRPYMEYNHLNQPLIGPLGKVEEVKYGFSSNFTKYWTFSAEQTRDIRNGAEPLLTRFGLGYGDECLQASVTFSRDFTERPDVKPGDSVYFHLYFKHLGGFETGPDETQKAPHY
ncbi:MAG: LPS-assembly protein LptD [Proteobacteria bacterium]|nr:LPS-assembly protein LptD [Pseudomonadota bacterium]